MLVSLWVADFRVIVGCPLVQCLFFCVPFSSLFFLFQVANVLHHVEAEVLVKITAVESRAERSYFHIAVVHFLEVS